MSDKLYLGQKAREMDYDGKASPITRVNLSVDSDNIYTAGDDTGRKLEVACPWGNQAMADSILLKLKEIDYQPYTANDALLDPASEIGDGITVGGIYSVIASASISYDKQCAADISAPNTDEIDDEYPYMTSEERAFNRQIAQTKSLISKTAEQIRLEVSNEIEGLSTSINVQLGSITSQITGLNGSISSITQTVDGITGRVESAEGAISTLEQTAESLSSSIQDANGNINTIEQTLEGVAFKSSLADGTTTINGGCITTGQILASYIKLGGYMDLYESLEGEDVAGKLGFTHIKNTWGSGGDFDALGFESSAHNVHLIASGKGGIAFLIGEEEAAILSNGSIEISPDNDKGVIYCTGRALMFHGVTIASSSSDSRLKKEIDYNQSEKMAVLFDKLRPVTFHMKDIREEDFHAGFIAQDVVAASKEAGLDNILTAIDDRGYYTLNYGELTAVLTAKVQQMDKRLKRLEELQWTS